MTVYQRYRQNMIRKMVIIPIIVVLLFSAAFYVALPHIQQALPNGIEYEMQTEEVQQ